MLKEEKRHPRSHSHTHQITKLEKKQEINCTKFLTWVIFVTETPFYSYEIHSFYAHQVKTNETFYSCFTIGRMLINPISSP